MTLETSSLAWTACTSALRLDRWMLGELRADDSERVSAHLAGCARCTAAVEEMRAVREEIRARPSPLQADPSRGGRPARGPAVGLVAAGLLAATLVLVVRGTSVPGERTKGASGPALGMYVQHGAVVRRAGPGEAVAPGDAVRFVVTTPGRAHVAVLGLDARGRASVYWPLAPRAEPVEPGVDVPLPLATRLDAVEGEERLLGLFCAAPVELEPVRAALETAGPAAVAPDGCQEVRWSFVKR